MTCRFDGERRENPAECVDQRRAVTCFLVHEQARLQTQIAANSQRAVHTHAVKDLRRLPSEVLSAVQAFFDRVATLTVGSLTPAEVVPAHSGVN